MLQDLYSVSCLNWILVALCLLQPGLEAFAVKHFLCNGVYVSCLPCAAGRGGGGGGE